MVDKSGCHRGARTIGARARRRWSQTETLAIGPGATRGVVRGRDRQCERGTVGRPRILARRYSQPRADSARAGRSSARGRIADRFGAVVGSHGTCCGACIGADPGAASVPSQCEYLCKAVDGFAWSGICGSQRGSIRRGRRHVIYVVDRTLIGKAQPRFRAAAADDANVLERPANDEAIRARLAQSIAT